MTPAHRREARFALAMLPVGVVLMVMSAVAFVAVLLLALAAPFRGGPWLQIELWALVAAAVAARNTAAGIAITAALDWRPLPMALLLSGLIVAAWPGWWLG
ncbi:MAG: hypothetical protein JWN21_213 [Sphingomonas bacterium]|uniref:hypothetical protein n=1 Tax=Sphingomonas bacterium TaxID=1895847 RepID=UPI0026201CB0|nr:hypothetical protein [Sphingomonas bacterium]MDB5694670.1 hypothetical protein [Sphingomonas bacterium]